MSDAKNAQPHTDSINAKSAIIIISGTIAIYLINEKTKLGTFVVPLTVFSFRLFMYAHRRKAVPRMHVIMSDSIGNRSVIVAGSFYS